MPDRGPMHCRARPGRLRERPRPWLGTAAATALLAVLGGLVGLPAPAGAATPPARAFYLDLGASISVGVQPSSSVPGGAPTHHGFANDLVAMERRRGVRLDLVQLGCPGESTASFVSGRDHCYHPPDSQLQAALGFLSHHRRQPGLVTVDLGFNDVEPCLHRPEGAPACMRRALAGLERRLPAILSELRRAAGPSVHMVGVGPFDPFVASYLHGQAGRHLAGTSLALMERLTSTERAIFAAAGIPTADVLRAFDAFGGGTRRLPDRAVVPVRVERACHLTWMCRPRPLGPNIHPDDAGYLVMARAIAALLPASWHARGATTP